MTIHCAGCRLISFWLAREWFNCNWARAIDREVSRIPRPVRQWLDRFSQSPLTGMFHPNKHGVWLHLSLLESRWDRLLVLGSALLPVRFPAVGAPGQDATKSRQQESCGLRSATRSMYCTSSSASHFIFEPCPTPFGTVSVGGLTSGGSVLRGLKDAAVSRAKAGLGDESLLFRVCLVTAMVASRAQNSTPCRKLRRLAILQRTTVVRQAPSTSRSIVGFIPPSTGFTRWDMRTLLLWG